MEATGLILMGIMVFVYLLKKESILDISLFKKATMLIIIAIAAPIIYSISVKISMFFPGSFSLIKIANYIDLIFQLVMWGSFLAAVFLFLCSIFPWFSRKED